MTNPQERISALSCWSTSIKATPLEGGITNANYSVEANGSRYFVRLGDDIPVHGIMRFNELAASRAAHAANVSPPVVHAENGALVLEFINAKTFAEEDVRLQSNLERILPLLARCHRDIPQLYRGPALVFWVFQVIRDYANTLRDGNSRMLGELPRLLEAAHQLEVGVGPVDIVFGHNDLLAANFLDDGERLWLVDWDYAGFNSPLFDLGGLASNNGLSAAQERWLLENYFETSLTDELESRYLAMKCASLLRETMWSMVSEIHSTLDFDYVAYTTENLQRFDTAFGAFQS